MFMRHCVAVALMSLFSATLAQAQNLDPRCSDRTAVGEFTCTITQPNVRNNDTPYPNVVFAPGDEMFITASGCVQTGGHGATWKRYVDPSGSGSDHLYHGLIRIPTATPGVGLVRIKDVIHYVGRLRVSGAGLPLSELVLHLGYEDDDYGDNGYYDHDDGTQNQCKNIGPAQVRIVIRRRSHVRPLPPLSDKYDFNLEWSAVAPGGFPVNPRWTWQRLHNNEIPSTAQCHNFSKSVLQSSGLVRVLEPDFSDCTNQTDLSHVDVPDGFNGFACSFGDSTGFHGHVNWFTVTLDGTVAWGAHNFDDDWTLEARVPNHGAYLKDENGRDRLTIHIEFDSDETIDNFKSSWWQSFHDAVDRSEAAPELLRLCIKAESVPHQPRFVCDRNAFQKDIDAPKTILNRGVNRSSEAIVTGLFGLDCEHNCKSELHPVYTLAAKVQDDPQDEVWAMFVRNAGNEGYCSRLIWEAPFTTYTFRLPWRAGMTGVEPLWGVGKSQFSGTPGTSGPRVTYWPNRWVDVTFTLPLPSATPLIDGALHLRWIGRPTSLFLRETPAASMEPSAETDEEADEPEGKLKAAVEQLPPARRQAFNRASRATALMRADMHSLPAGGAARKVTEVPRTPRLPRGFRNRLPQASGAAVLLGRKAGVASRKRERDTARARALCVAYSNAPPGVPAGACKLLR